MIKTSRNMKQSMEKERKENWGLKLKLRRGNRKGTRRRGRGRGRSSRSSGCSSCCCHLCRNRERTCVGNFLVVAVVVAFAAFELSLLVAIIDDTNDQKQSRAEAQDGNDDLITGRERRGSGGKQNGDERENDQHRGLSKVVCVVLEGSGEHMQKQEQNVGD
jgi:hypothetical protein